MRTVDKLIVKAKHIVKVDPGELRQYDFGKLTTNELIEIAYGDPSDERIQELADKARIS